MEAFEFYSGVLKDLAKTGRMPLDANVLVVAGGQLDKSVLQAVGFRNVTISNMDERMVGDEFAPFRWELQDAEALTYDDGAFDFVAVHAGLHHCRVPHQALAEMYRVARKGVLFIESRDSALMKLAGRLGIVPDYEVEAVVGNGLRFGGVRNSATPNFVYRWTEREVEKIARSIDPTGPLDLKYFYALRLPISRLKMHRNGAVRLIASALGGPAALVAKLLRTQGNLFGVFIGRPTTRWPWLNRQGEAVIDRTWAEARFVVEEGARQH